MNVKILPTEDTTLPWFDFTKLTALASCPRRGLFEYVLNKTASGRNTALEAGEVMHQSFAAMRWQQLYSKYPQHHDLLIQWFTNFLGSEDRFDEVKQKLNDPLLLATEVLYTSGYYDDPNDKKRTLANMELALALYYSEVNAGILPVPLLQVENGKINFIGIEVPIDITIHFDDEPPFRYIGRIDAVAERNDELIILENKTTTVMGDEWAAQWLTSHQPVGYWAGLVTQYSITCNTVFVVGLNIPISRSNPTSSFRYVPVPVGPERLPAWLVWINFLTDLVAKYKGKETEAPMFTNSCYSYFKPCTFMDVCLSDDPKGTLAQFADRTWNPHD